MLRLRDHPYLLGIMVTGSLMVGIFLVGSLPVPTARPSCNCPAEIDFGARLTGRSVEGSTYSYNFTIQYSGTMVTVSALSFQLLNVSGYGNVTACYGQSCGRDGSVVTLAGTQVVLLDASGCDIAIYNLLGGKPLLPSSSSCAAPSLQGHVVVGDLLSLTSSVDVAQKRYALSTPWGFTTIS